MRVLEDKRKPNCVPIRMGTGTVGTRLTENGDAAPSGRSGLIRSSRSADVGNKLLFGAHGPEPRGAVGGGLLEHAVNTIPTASAASEMWPP